jgi:aldehyde:ferredoxin oxidoreductase
MYGEGKIMMFPEAKVLEVDLTTEKIEVKTIPEYIYRLYPGGSALGLYLILQEMPAGVDPMSPENMLVFAVSPLTGLPISGSSRMTVTTKSPLTGTIADSQVGGSFPARFKGNGWDAVVFKGKAKKPVYLYIDGETVTLKPAGHLWGTVTGETERLIRDELGDPNVEIAEIGPGGENLVKYASIMCGANRAAGRCGTGAVMGSKNLKAVVVKRAKPPQPVNKEAFSKLAKRGAEKAKTKPAIAAMTADGTNAFTKMFSDFGILPTRNYTSGYFPEGAEEINGATISKRYLKKNDTCYSCAVRCKRVCEIPGKVDPLYGGPEYETVGVFGSVCGNSNLESILIAHQLCEMYSLDTISCGATIAFAMECYEKGIIDKETTGGIELNFGNYEAMLKLIEMIAKREGFGDVLAEGSARAAEKFGPEAIKRCMTVKSKEFPCVMAEFKGSLQLIYAVNPFGTDHCSSDYDTSMMNEPDSEDRIRQAMIGNWKGYDNPVELDDEKIRYTINTQKYYSILDTLCLCIFVWGGSWGNHGPEGLVSLCKDGIGWDTSLYELMLVGERRINMMRYFNQREGFTRADDVLPERMFEEGLADGPTKGVCVNKKAFDKALNTYYQFIGWDEQTGNPTEATLKRLSLGWLLDK